MLPFLLATLLGSTFAAPFSSNSPTVKISSGTFVGKSFSGVDSFLGIPFALPPIGNLRFAPPVATNLNYGVFDATKYGYACPQIGILAGAVPGLLGELANSVVSIVEKLPILAEYAGGNSSEDCLSINVQVPAGTVAGDNLPVLFWIFGGAYTMGNSGSFEGTSIIRKSISRNQPMILVTSNHRINSFGFLPGRQVAADPSTSCNAGLQDQRLAMKWVQSNIAAFGGDPTRVTIGGESSGAISVGFHMLIDRGNPNGLFRAAIMQSGAPIPVEGPSRGQPSFDALTLATGCDKAINAIACLRAVPYNKLVAATNLAGNFLSRNSVALKWVPRTDGVLLTDQAQNLIAQGKYAKIPIISGNQYDEGTILTLGTLSIQDEPTLKTYLGTVFFPNATNENLDRILQEYPEDPTQGSPFDTGHFNLLTSQNKRISALIGDVVFQTPRRAFVTALQRTQPVWSYASRAFNGLPILGTFHLSDTFAVTGQLPITPSNEMQSRWIAFVNTMDPNVNDRIYWPQYSESQSLIQFNLGESTIIPDTYRQRAIAYIASLQNVLAL